MRRLQPLIWALAAILGISSANASVLVTTGPGNPGYGGADIFGASASSPPYSAGQSLAGEFTLSTPVFIESVEGWMATVPTGTLTAVLYRNHENVPGIQLHTAQFTALSTTYSGGVAANWYGPAGLSWYLGPGTYWLAFEVRPGDSLFGIYPNQGGGVTMYDGSPSPLSLYSYGDNAPGTYTSSFSDPNVLRGWGMQVLGRALSVPEPSSLWLLLGGLGALGLVRRMRAAYSRRG